MGKKGKAYQCLAVPHWPESLQFVFRRSHSSGVQHLKHSKLIDLCGIKPPSSAVRWTTDLPRYLFFLVGLISHFLDLPDHQFMWTWFGQWTFSQLMKFYWQLFCWTDYNHKSVTSWVFLNHCWCTLMIISDRNRGPEAATERAAGVGSVWLVNEKHWQRGKTHLEESFIPFDQDINITTKWILFECIFIFVLSHFFKE